jgi:hypothetical protein
VRREAVAEVVGQRGAGVGDDVERAERGGALGRLGEELLSRQVSGGESNGLGEEDALP